MSTKQSDVTWRKSWADVRVSFSSFSEVLSKLLSPLRTGRDSCCRCDGKQERSRWRRTIKQDKQTRPRGSSTLNSALSRAHEEKKKKFASSDSKFIYKNFNFTNFWCAALWSVGSFHVSLKSHRHGQSNMHKKVLRNTSGIKHVLNQAFNEPDKSWYTSFSLPLLLGGTFHWAVSICFMKRFNTLRPI